MNLRGVSEVCAESVPTGFTDAFLEQFTKDRRLDLRPVLVAGVSKQAQLVRD
jgi:hypothetical protein